MQKPGNIKSNKNGGKTKFRVSAYQLNSAEADASNKAAPETLKERRRVWT
jgi:hypothetical protein